LPGVFKPEWGRWNRRIYLISLPYLRNFQK